MLLSFKGSYFVGLLLHISFTQSSAMDCLYSTPSHWCLLHILKADGKAIVQNVFKVFLRIHEVLGLSFKKSLSLSMTLMYSFSIECLIGSVHSAGNPMVGKNT